MRKRLQVGELGSANLAELHGRVLPQPVDLNLGLVAQLVRVLRGPLGHVIGLFFGDPQDLLGATAEAGEVDLGGALMGVGQRMVQLGILIGQGRALLLQGIELGLDSVRELFDCVAVVTAADQWKSLSGEDRIGCSGCGHVCSNVRMNTPPRVPQRYRPSRGRTNSGARGRDGLRYLEPFFPFDPGR